jgi:hypothetical protein
MPRDAHGNGTPGPEGGSRGRIGLPVAATVAAGVIAVQAVFLAAASVVLAISGLQPDTVDRTGAEILAALGLLAAVAVLVLARGVGGGRRWARSPVLVIELICLPIAVTVVQGGRWYAGVPLGLTALAVLALLAASGQLARPE